MYFELQISVRAFTGIVRDRLKALSLCDNLDAEFVDQHGAMLMVDRIVIQDSTTIQREPNDPVTQKGTQKIWIFSLQTFTAIDVPFLQVKQLVHIHLGKPADFETNGPKTSRPYMTVPISPVYNISLTTTNQTQGGGPVTLTYTLAYVDFGLLHDVYSDEQRQEITQALAGVTIEPITMDLKALEKLLERPVTALNAGIACGPDDAFVALRVDFDVKDSPGGVTREFFEDGPPNRLAGKDWALFVDSATFTLDAQKKAKAALQKKPLEMKLISGPDACWAPGAPGVIVSATLKLFKACLDDDMDVDVHLLGSVSVPAPNTLRTHFNMSGEPSTGQVGLYAVTGTLLWPCIGPTFFEDQETEFGIMAYLGGLAGMPLMTLIGLVVAIESQTSAEDFSQDLGKNCMKLNDENYECNDVVSMELPLGMAGVIKLDLEKAYGVPEGLVIAGSIWRSAHEMGSLEVFDVQPFAIARGEGSVARQGFRQHGRFDEMPRPA